MQIHNVHSERLDFSAKNTGINMIFFGAIKNTSVHNKMQ